MRFSLWPSANQPWGDLLDVALHADGGRWDTLYIADHFMGDGTRFGPPEDPTFEATAVVAALAGATQRVRLANLVLSMTYRHPAVLAKWATTVDHASGGRLTLGLGAGWQVNEHEQYGIPLGTPGERLRRFAEGIEVITGLLSQPRTTVHGDFFHITDALSEPKPVQQRIPLLVGGKGDRMLRLVARCADEWNRWSVPGDVSERSTALDRACEELGRDPATIHRSTQALVLVTDDAVRAKEFESAPMPALAGTPARIAEAAAAWRDEGVDEVIIPDWDLGVGTQRRESLDALAEALSPLR